MEDKVVNLEQGFSVGEPHPEADYIRAKRPQNQVFDQIVLYTVPRSPSSPLSKWTTSVRADFLKKGKIIHEASYRDMKTALSLLPAEYLNAEEDPKNHILQFNHVCDQEGCTNVATVAYRLKGYICPQCHTVAMHKLQPEMRKFCEEHKWRGKNKTDDSMDNYEEIK